MYDENDPIVFICRLQFKIIPTILLDACFGSRTFFFFSPLERINAHIEISYAICVLYRMKTMHIKM